MPYIFISKNKIFTDKITEKGFTALNTHIQDYVPRKNAKTFYLLPGNSFGFMDSGLEFVYSKILFINIHKYLNFLINKYGKTNLENRKYLPIGSSIIIDYLDNRFLVYSPSMLTVQNIHKTNNCYYSCMASLYNILENRKEKLNEVDIIIPSICCGLGGMAIEDSVNQILNGIRDYKNYKPYIEDNNVIIYEPNLNEQPLYLQNKQFKEVNILKLFKNLKL